MKDAAASERGAVSAPADFSWSAPPRRPEDGQAFWLKTADGRTLRAAYWPTGHRGVAILFQGRTEYIEKYAEPIARLQAMGFAVATLDWRGQGRSERALSDPRKGYVRHFAEFQQDVDALLAHLAEIGAPKPWVLFAHSMGGAIAARALMRLNEGPAPQFAACVLSAPMLGLYGSPSFLSAARIASSLLCLVGLRTRYALGCDRRTAADLGFQDNVLTSDAERFDVYSRQIAEDERLALGGPTWSWLNAAMRETARLQPTRTPTLILIGTDDRVVSVGAAQRYAADIERGQVVMLPKARHEPFQETDAVQERMWPAIESFLTDLGI